MADGGGKHFCITIVFNLLNYNLTVNIHIKIPQEVRNVHMIKSILFIITCLLYFFFRAFIILCILLSIGKTCELYTTKNITNYNINILNTQICAVCKIDFGDNFQLYVCKNQLIMLMRCGGIFDVASFITLYEQLQ